MLERRRFDLEHRIGAKGRGLIRRSTDVVTNQQEQQLAALRLVHGPRKGDCRECRWTQRAIRLLQIDKYVSHLCTLLPESSRLQDLWLRCAAFDELGH